MKIWHISWNSYKIVLGFNGSKGWQKETHRCFLKAYFCFIAHYAHRTPLRKWRSRWGSLCRMPAWWRWPHYSIVPGEGDALSSWLPRWWKWSWPSISTLISLWKQEYFFPFEEGTLGIVWLPFPSCSKLLAFTPKWAPGYCSLSPRQTLKWAGSWLCWPLSLCTPMQSSELLTTVEVEGRVSSVLGSDSSLGGVRGLGWRGSRASGHHRV